MVAGTSVGFVQRISGNTRYNKAETVLKVIMGKWLFYSLDFICFSLHFNKNNIWRVKKWHLFGFGKKKDEEKHSRLRLSKWIVRLLKRQKRTQTR